MAKSLQRGLLLRNSLLRNVSAVTQKHTTIGELMQMVCRTEECCLLGCFLRGINDECLLGEYPTMGWIINNDSTVTDRTVEIVS
jgi:hypothetical protein